MLGTGIANKVGLQKLVPFIHGLIKSIKLNIELKLNAKRTKLRKKTKVFVIGFNKTGTTSLEKTLSEFGYIMGYQRNAELLMKEVMKNNYYSLIEFCKTAEAFQDLPFSSPKLYTILDQEYPDSKFILTVRDSDEQWYNSLIKFHSKLWGKDNNLPNEEDLANATYVFKGYTLRVIKYLFGEELYNKENYIQKYNNHINDAKNYFKDNPNKLITINVSKKDDYKKLCNFLNEKPLHDTFVWMNKT